MNMSYPLIISNHDQIDPLKKFTLVLCWLLYHQAAMQPAPSHFMSTAHWGCIFLVSNCWDLLYKCTFIVHVPWPLHFSLSLELASNTWTVFFFFFFHDSVTQTSFDKNKKGVCGTGSVSPPDNRDPFASERSALFHDEAWNINSWNFCS